MISSDRIVFRKAVATDIGAVENIYKELHRAEESGIISIGWKRSIYPVRSTAEEALIRDDLFALECNGNVLGAGMINKIQVDVYLKAPGNMMQRMIRSVFSIPLSFHQE